MNERSVTMLLRGFGDLAFARKKIVFTVNQCLFQELIRLIINQDLRIEQRTPTIASTPPVLEIYIWTTWTAYLANHAIPNGAGTAQVALWPNSVTYKDSASWICWEMSLGPTPSPIRTAPPGTAGKRARMSLPTSASGMISSGRKTLLSIPADKKVIFMVKVGG